MLWLLLACTPEPSSDAPPPPTDAPDATGDTGTPSPTGDTATTPRTGPSPWPADALVLSNAMLLDASGARGPETVVVADGAIVWIGAAAGPLPDDATELDVSGAWLTPGLVDPHVHLFLSGTAVWVGDTVAYNVRAQLARGVTSVVDAGGPLVSVALRDRVARTGVGPSMRVLGPMITVPGSHPCESLDDPSFCAYATTPEEAEAIALAHADAGTDGLKAALADAAFTPWPTPRLDPAALEAAVASHAGPTLAHVDTVTDAQDALDAGVTVLGHPVFGGPPLAAEAADVALRAHGVHTTIGAFSGTLDLLEGRTPTDSPELAPAVRRNWSYLAENPAAFDPTWVAETAIWWSNAETSVSELRAAGAVLLPASDAGYYYVPHGLGLHLELQRLQALGWSAEELLMASTATAAEVSGWTDRGWLEIGQRADLLVVDANPLDDIAALQSPRWVIVGGDARTPEEWLDADLSGTDDGVCLGPEDCSSSACDRVAHECTTACDPSTAFADPTCGPDAACLPDDLLDGPSVCRALRTCDPSEATPCSPALPERCVRFDIDTYACIPR